MCTSTLVTPLTFKTTQNTSQQITNPIQTHTRTHKQLKSGRDVVQMHHFCPLFDLSGERGSYLSGKKAPTKETRIANDTSQAVSDVSGVKGWHGKFMAIYEAIVQHKPRVHIRAFKVSLDVRNTPSNQPPDKSVQINITKAPTVPYTFSLLN